MPQIDSLLRRLKELNGSDLHISAGSPPRVRRQGTLASLPKTDPLDDPTVCAMLQEIMPPEMWNTFVLHNDVDFAYALPGVGRYRVNGFRQELGRGAVMRTIPERVLGLADLKLPPVVDTLADLHEGLVLVTGPTGSGKSTTLAALLDKINHTHHRHVVTIEDPVEFVHQNDKCIFSHREVGHHTKSFAKALRASIREDADIVMVGEMRDYETAQLAMTAAEMGALVFGTLHTTDAAKTISRLVEMFPPAQQPQARSTISESLSAVISQLLVPTADGKSRRAATEILVRTVALPNLIRENNLSMIFSVIQSGRAQGMQTMDQSLKALVQEGAISESEAYLRATDKTMFKYSAVPVDVSALTNGPVDPAHPDLVVTQAPGGGFMVTSKSAGTAPAGNASRPGGPAGGPNRPGTPPGRPGGR